MGRSRFIYDIMMKFYQPFKLLEKLPFMSSGDSHENTSAHIIPVEMVVDGGRNTVLPMDIIRILVEKAQHVGIMDHCLCRKGEGCSQYPVDFGCLMLGPSLEQLHPRLGSPVTKEEALSHAKKGIGMGLYPMVVHNQFDAWMWGINYRGMLNVCFCCPCCCSVRHSIASRVSEGFFQNIHRIPGLTVQVQKDDCNGCHMCTEVCMSNAITMLEGKAHVIQEHCKGCGRCVQTCPRDAIIIEIATRTSISQEVFQHYNERTSVFKSTDN